MSRDDERHFAARAWLRRHGFTAGARVEELARAAADAHADATVEGRDRDDAALLALTEGSAR